MGYGSASLQVCLKKVLGGLLLHGRRIEYNACVRDTVLNKLCSMPHAPTINLVSRKQAPASNTLYSRLLRLHNGHQASSRLVTLGYGGRGPCMCAKTNPKN